MRRFSSLTYAPAETRKLLADRLGRYLPAHRATHVSGPKGVVLADEALLHLLLGLSIEFESGWERARATYGAALLPDAAEPSLEDLVAAGWVRSVWGRLTTAFDLARAARSAPGMAAFGRFLAERHKRTYRFTEATRGRSDLAGVAKAIETGEIEPNGVGCQTPEWVAARLWDRTLPDHADPSAALRIWVDRWNLLGRPSLVPGRVWGEVAAVAFREAAFAVLEANPAPVGWDEARAGFAKQAALASKQAPADLEAYIPPVPATVVDRALWLEGRALEHAMQGTLETLGDVFGLVRLLLADVEAEHHAPAPHKIVGRLFGLAADRPELLLMVLLTMRQHPVLLADMLLHPANSALGCLVVAQWRSPGSGWERELLRRDDHATKAVAFADAVSVMGHFLRQGSVGPEEAAALLSWLHLGARRGTANDLGDGEAMLAIMRAELAAHPPETLKRMAAGLITAMPQAGFGTPASAAALDLIHMGNLAGEVDPAPLVDAYVRTVAAGDYSLTVHRVAADGAAALFEAAARSPELRGKFLFPVGAERRMALRAAVGQDAYALAEAVARSTRAHIRVLCRALVGRKATVPDDLVEALVGAVRAGALEHKEKGRVAAFSPRFEESIYGEPLDRPIAADLGAAINALTGGVRERLLAAILETDEPAFLAKLLSFAPHAVRPRIEKRVSELTPDDAGEIRSLTELQARIDELLSAGALGAAARFMEAERDLETWGPVPGRALARLRAHLRLQFLRGDWAAIAGAQAPRDMPPADQEAAADAIGFYQALAELRPGGDLDASERTLARLHGRRPDVVAYTINLFAVRVSRLLGSDLFVRLEGEAVRHARQALDEAERAVGDPRALSAPESEAFTSNKALLVLALGDPDQAFQMLATLRTAGTDDRVAAYSAVALSRMERVPEAMAILAAAENAIGPNDTLAAARANIESGASFLSTAVVVTDDDPQTHVRHALSDLLRMDPIRQAEVLQPEPEPLDALAIRYVRSAAASVVSLVPMMRNVTIDSSEDDLTALVRELLSGYFHLLGWSLADQSKGGYTAKGNPGERDLVLRKDSATLAVLEAVVCNRPVTHEWTRRELTSHFQKLFAYSTCRLFFHLTYAYIDDLGSIISFIGSMAEQAVPAGFTYLRREEIPFTDSRPTGLVARYEGPVGEVKVAFLVLDLAQSRQRHAAQTAATSNPRKGRTPPT